MSTDSVATGTSTPTNFGGGGGKTLASCMELWEPVLGMTKAEWKATCVRTLNGMDLPAYGLLNADAKPTRHAHVRNAHLHVRHHHHAQAHAHRTPLHVAHLDE